MTAPTPPILAAHGIVKRMAQAGACDKLIDGVEIEIKAGEWVAITGRSGAGKSTLLHILGLLDPDYEGSVQYDGQRVEPLSDCKKAALRNQTVGFIFQSYNLLEHVTVLENVLLPGIFSGERLDPQRGQHLLSRVALAAKAEQKAGTLSGGERQRVAIARALYQRPRVVLCDEPTGNLDPTTAQEIVGLFAALQQEGLALVIATHDETIAKTANRVLRLQEGKLR